MQKHFCIHFVLVMSLQLLYKHIVYVIDSMFFTFSKQYCNHIQDEHKLTTNQYDKMKLWPGMGWCGGPVGKISSAIRKVWEGLWAGFGKFSLDSVARRPTLVEIREVIFNVHTHCFSCTRDIRVMSFRKDVSYEFRNPAQPLTFPVGSDVPL